MTLNRHYGDSILMVDGGGAMMLKIHYVLCGFHYFCCLHTDFLLSLAYLALPFPSSHLFLLFSFVSSFSPSSFLLLLLVCTQISTWITTVKSIDKFRFMSSHVLDWSWLTPLVCLRTLLRVVNDCSGVWPLKNHRTHWGATQKCWTCLIFVPYAYLENWLYLVLRIDH